MQTAWAAARGAAVVVLLVGCSTGGAPSELQSGPTSSPATVLPSQEALELPPVERLPSTVVVVRGAPAALLAAHGRLWVQTHRDTVLRQLDPVTGGVVGRTDVAMAGCGDLTWAAGSVWQTGCDITPGLVRVDAATAQVLETLPWDAIGPAYDGEALWLCTSPNAPFGVRRIALSGGRDSTFRVPGIGEGCGSMAAVAGSIWVTEALGALVYRLDRDTGEVLAAIPMPVPASDGYVIEHDGAPWYVDPELGVLVRVDPDSGETQLSRVRLRIPTQYLGLAFSSAPGPAGRVWVRSGDDEVWLLDTRTDEVLRRIAVIDGGGGDVQQIGDVLWVASFGTDQVQRIALGDE
jgi:streptogramin lyase